jgi:DNA modification methylase
MVILSVFNCDSIPAKNTKDDYKFTTPPPNLIYNTNALKPREFYVETVGLP